MCFTLQVYDPTAVAGSGNLREEHAAACTKARLSLHSSRPPCSSPSALQSKPLHASSITHPTHLRHTSDTSQKHLKHASHPPASLWRFAVSCFADATLYAQMLHEMLVRQLLPKYPTLLADKDQSLPIPQTAVRIAALVHKNIHESI